MASNQRNLFDVGESRSTPPPNWRDVTPPELRGEKRIRLDAETNSLEWWKPTTKPVGWAWLLPESGRRGYLAFGHKYGNNCTEEQAKEWARRELRGVHIDNVNTKYDMHISRGWGVDLAEQSNTFGDVAFRAALLDDHRFRFNLNALAKDFLGEDEGKVDLDLADKGTLWERPGWEIAPYAIHDVELVDGIVNATQPEIDAQDLRRVLKLEEDVLPCVVEMEKNGAYLDMELLEKWRTEATREYEQILYDTFRQSGVRVTSPDSSKDLKKLFIALGIPFTSFTGSFDKEGNPKPSFTGEVLDAIDHPIIQRLRYAAQLGDLKSKYLDKYWNTVRSDGWIRFNLHQLRVGRSEDDKKGTVSGRFSSAGDDYGGFNVQQVVSADKQQARNWCPKYVVRNLFVPKHGQWLAVDAKQIEYRIFAHYANSEAILRKYIDDPEVDYHNIVQAILQRVKPDIGRKKTKITNFCKLFGSGIIKFAFTLETITEQQFKDLNEKYAIHKWRKGSRGAREAAMRTEPLLREAVEVMDAYDGMMPEAKHMLDLAKRTANERGYVMTMLGRRARFPGGQRAHSALNRIVQGTAADINKLMMVDVYRERHNLGLHLRMTVHDELDADVLDPSTLPQLEEFFNQQRVDLRVPILWDAGVGPTWGTAKGKA